jgi:hypothetical protein
MKARFTRLAAAGAALALLVPAPVALAVAPSSAPSIAPAAAPAAVRLGSGAAGSTGPTNPHVSYDRYSLLIDGKRVIINSGEVHYFRIPDPDGWREVLERAKAAGVNTIETYVPWSYHEPAPGQFRFTGAYDVERFLSEARDAGLYVIVRPGPNTTGGVDGGGVPSWALGQAGYLRTADPIFTAQWKAWYQDVVPRLARWQIGGANKGTVIMMTLENEYIGRGAGATAFMQDLYSTSRALGMTVPLVNNDAIAAPSLPSGQVADMYGFDHYPLACTTPCGAEEFGTEWDTSTFSEPQPLGAITLPATDQLEEYFRARGVTDTPLYAAEISGGIFPSVFGFGGKSPQSLYDKLVGYTTVQQLTALGQGITLLDQWPLAGGTSWGYSASSAFSTSYDWLASIRESTALGPRFEEQRRLAGQMTTTQESLAATENTPGAVTATADAAGLYRVRTSTADGGLHIFLRNADNVADLAPRLVIDGQVTPPVPLPRRSARYLPANVRVAGWDIGWTTAEVLHASPETLVLFGDRGQRYAAEIDGRRIDVTVGVPTLLPASRGRHILVVDRSAAARTWFVGGRILVGPSLVTPRGISVDRPTRLTTIRNGELTTRRLAGPPSATTLDLPRLSDWRYAREPGWQAVGFDDSTWTHATDATAPTQVQPLTSPVLFADQYGAPTGYVQYRGTFDGAATGMCIEGRHRYHVWLNGTSIGTYSSLAGVENSSIANGVSPPVSQPVQIPFPAGSLRDSGNVIAVLTDDWGHNMDFLGVNLAKEPRGLISARLDRGAGATCGFTISGAPTVPGTVPTTSPVTVSTDGGIDWRLRGGVPSRYPNASGLSGELEGWSRAGFDDRSWPTVSVPRVERAGLGEVGWYRTRFTLPLPACVTAPMGIRFPSSRTVAEVYLNGIHIGRIGRGATDELALTPGLLHTDGRRNTLAVAHWNVGTGSMPEPRLFAYETRRESANAGCGLR